MSPENEAEMKRRLRRAGVVGSCLLAAIVVIGGGIRFVQASSLKTWTHETEIPTVTLIAPEAGGKNQALVLPGTVQAYYDAQLYSRVPGYVHAWYKDIGAHVKKGDVLALIDTPELDQQITQARADLSAAQSAQKLSAATAERWNHLLSLGAVAKQDADEKNADLAGKISATQAAKANLDQQLAMKAFARIVAPFDGTVTRRTVDVGSLVSAGPATNGDPLFAVSDTHALRVYVEVPQSYSAQIAPGMQATLTVPEYPGKTFPARMVSTSNAINTQSSTLLVEFQADNAAGLLKPGDYAQVSLGLPGAGAHLRLPASTLMFRAEGLRVATVDANNRIVMKPITIETDLGTQVVVGSGLTPKDRVVDNPPDSLGNGDEVRVEGSGHAR